MEEINMKQTALDYAKEGIPVFPLVPNEKRPFTGRGFKDATTDLAVINQWWDKWPNANIGMPTGRTTGTLIVDVDCKEGTDGYKSLQDLESNYGKLPESRRHNTPSGGYHLLFSTGSLVIPNSASKLGNGIDIRGEGGYILVPPSVIDGNRYKVVDTEVEIAEAPEWLIKLALEDKKKEAPKDRVLKGERNDYIFNKAVGCRKLDLPYQEAEKVVVEANGKCDPPLSEREVQRTLDSAYRYEARAVPPEIEELNRTHAAIKMSGNCYVLEEIICPTFNRPHFELLSVKCFASVGSELSGRLS